MPVKTVNRTKMNQADKSSKSTGHVIQVIGPVVDVEFNKLNLPNIYDALEVKIPSNQVTKQPSNLILEVQQHLGESQVRSVSLGPTDGLKRGTIATNTKSPISVPVGVETLGRIFNVAGQTIDGKGPVVTKKKYPINRPSPPLTEQ